jgi:WD40 repeat protein
VRADFIRTKHTLKGHQKPVTFVAWSPDDTKILTCGNEEVVKLWDVQTGECKHTLDKQNSFCSSCAWFPDGKRFVTGGSEKCIYIWDLEGKELDAWKGSRMPRISVIAITRDGSHLVSVCGDRYISIYNLELKIDRVIEEEKCITSRSVSRDGMYLLVNLVSQEIHLWDITEDESTIKPFKYKGHRQGRYVIRSCFGGSDQGFILSGSEDSQVNCRGCAIFRSHLLVQYGQVLFISTTCSSWNFCLVGMLVAKSETWSLAMRFDNV